MKVLDYRPPKFSVFASILDNQVDCDDAISFHKSGQPLTKYFKVNGVTLSNPVNNEKVCRTVYMNDNYLLLPQGPRGVASLMCISPASREAESPSNVLSLIPYSEFSTQWQKYETN